MFIFDSFSLFALIFDFTLVYHIRLCTYNIWTFEDNSQCYNIYISF